MHVCSSRGFIYVYFKPQNTGSLNVIVRRGKVAFNSLANNQSMSKGYAYAH